MGNYAYIWNYAFHSTDNAITSAGNQYHTEKPVKKALEQTVRDDYPGKEIIFTISEIMEIEPVI